MLWFFLFILLLGLSVVLLALGVLQEKETASRWVHILPTAAHGVLDYLLGGVLIALPWLLGGTTGGAAMWVPIVLGSGLILYSLCTEYEFGLMPWIPMPVHLVLDGVGGLFLFASPLLFGFYPELLDPYLAIGVLEVGLALITHPHTASEKVSS